MIAAVAPIERQHRLTAIVDGKEVWGFTSYAIDHGILEPADAFTLSIPADEDVWNALRADRPVKLLIDGVPRITGYIDAPACQWKDGTISVRGRSKIGRLVQESAPSVNYTGKTLLGLVADLASPWFSKVVLSNARNRKVMRGKGKKAASTDTVYVDSRVGRRIEPGQMRWAVIEELCRQAGYICWESGDGKELIIGQLDYLQEVQFRFFHAKPGSRRSSNVLDGSVRPSTADRYSKIQVFGAGAGDVANYGLPTAARAGQAKNNPLTTHGDGKDFSAPKRLVLVDRDVKDRKTAEILAKRQMARRDMSKEPITIVAPLHGQRVQGREFTLFACDTLAHVEDEVTGTEGVYTIVACSDHGDENGETSTLELLPKGTEIAA